jgi:hypothetical protein
MGQGPLTRWHCLALAATSCAATRARARPSSPKVLGRRLRLNLHIVAQAARRTARHAQRPEAAARANSAAMLSPLNASDQERWRDAVKGVREGPQPRRCDCRRPPAVTNALARSAARRHSTRRLRFHLMSRRASDRRAGDRKALWPTHHRANQQVKTRRRSSIGWAASRSSRARISCRGQTRLSCSRLRSRTPAPHPMDHCS